MRDLIHDLALSLAQNEFRNTSAGRQEQDIYKRIKHVLLSRKEDLVGEEVPKSFLKKSSGVRGVMPTIWCMCFDGKGGDRIGEVVKTCISKLKHLRVLNRRNTSLEQLPNSIATLKHLKSLNLSGCKRLKRLPNSITKLYNLQALLLGGCEELPKDVGDLINLKQLAITTKQKCLSAATANGIKSLRYLQLLLFADCPNLEYIFESEEDDDEPRPQLVSLIYLGMSQFISLMFLFGPSTSTLTTRKRSCLKILETLAIGGCQNLDLGLTLYDEISFVCLKLLMLCSLPQMESLPPWKCVSTLESLIIDDCLNLTSLPEWLQSLTTLRKLKIQNCPKILCLPERIQCLTALTELKIVGGPNLSKRCIKGKGEDWPKIAHIRNLRLVDKLED